MSSLSDKDREILAQMEQEFSKEDPKFAETMASAHVPVAFSPRKVVLGILIVFVGISIVIGSLVASLTPLSLLGFGVMVAGGLYMSATAPKKLSNSPQPAGSRQQGSFMKRLEDKWDQRKERESER